LAEVAAPGRFFRKIPSLIDGPRPRPAPAWAGEIDGWEITPLGVGQIGRKSGRMAFQTRADPGFDPAQRVYYYARSIEMPTPRWPAFDEVRFGINMDKKAKRTLRKPSNTSPIWRMPWSACHFRFGPTGRQ
jgi:hypothetical protein